MSEIFELQERVSRSIVETLAIRLSTREDHALTEHAISDVRAFELYLRARRGIWSLTREGLGAAQRDLERAVALERDNPVLLSQLAHVHYEFWNFGIRLDEGDLRLARDYAEETLRLAPDSADPHFLHGMLEVTGGDVVCALRHLDRALAIDPTHPDALAAHPALTSFMGLEDEARAKLIELGRIDPLSALNWSLPIWIEITTGRFEATIREAQRVRSAHPTDLLVEFGYGYALALSGRRAAAVPILRGVHEANDHLIARTFAALACALDGEREAAIDLVAPDLERWAWKDMAYSLWIAETFALIGETERALDWLDNAVEHGNINSPFIAKYDPFLAPLRGTERFEVIAKRARAGRERWHAEHPVPAPAAGVSRFER